MITLENLKQELNAVAKISVKIKREMDAAKTKTKRDYFLKKLTKNNIYISKLLNRLEKLKGINDERSSDETRNAQTESERS